MYIYILGVNYIHVGFLSKKRENIKIEGLQTFIIQVNG